MIASLETYEDQFKPEHAAPAAVVLFNLLPEIPERQRSMFELDTRFTVTRVVLRLLRRLQTPAAVEATVREILPELKSLSSRLELIRLVGHRENVGSKLVSEDSSREFEKSWRNQVRAASLAQLIQERDVGSILFLTKRDADPSEGTLIIQNTPELTLALLRSARTETRSQTLGSRAVKRVPLLNWDALIELYGDEATLRERIEELKATHPPDADDLLELADKYLSGWRPKRLDYAP